MSKEQSKALFYTQGVEEVLKSLDTSIDGLSTAQAKERLDAYGYNELDEGEKRSLLSKFIDQFKDLMIIILLVAAALSIITARSMSWSTMMTVTPSAAFASRSPLSWPDRKSVV